MLTKLCNVKKTILFISLITSLFFHGYAGSHYFPAFNFNNIEFLIGIKGGINLSNPLVLNRFSVFENANDNSLPPFKTYNTFVKNIGTQFGILLVARFKETNYLMLQPGITTHVIRYTELHEWQGTSGSNEQSSLTYRHKQTLRYFEMPVIFRKELSTQTFRPYVQGGVFYGLQQSAVQYTDISETITNGQNAIVISGGTRSGSITDQYIKSHLGLMGGAGIAYHLNSVIICLDGLYKFGLHNITNEQNRYANQSLVGDTFDVPDDINLNALMISVNIIFKIGDSNRKKALKCP